MPTYFSMRYNGKKISVHRFVMQKKIGRALSSDEVVHHINGNKHDNRVDNLSIMNPSEHSILHNTKYPRKTICVVCGKEFAPHETNRKNGKICSLECKAKYMHPISVLQFTLNGEFVRSWDSVRDAARQIGVSHSNIIACCKGRQATCKNYKWRYNL